MRGKEAVIERQLRKYVKSEEYEPRRYLGKIILEKEIARAKALRLEWPSSTRGPGRARVPGAG